MVGRRWPPIASGLPSFIPRENTAESYLHSKRLLVADQRTVSTRVPASQRFANAIPYAKSLPRRRVDFEISFVPRRRGQFTSRHVRNLSGSIRELFSRGRFLRTLVAFSRTISVPRVSFAENYLTESLSRCIWFYSIFSDFSFSLYTFHKFNIHA